MRLTSLAYATEYQNRKKDDQRINGGFIGIPISYVYLVVYGEISVEEPEVEIEAEPELVGQSFARHGDEKFSFLQRMVSNPIYGNSAILTTSALSTQNEEEDLDRALHLSLRETVTASFSHSVVPEEAIAEDNENSPKVLDPIWDEIPKRKTQQASTSKESIKDEEQEADNQCFTNICLPCLPAKKKNKQEDSGKAPCVACPIPRKKKKMDTSTDEGESDSQGGSSISSQAEDEDLDLLTIGLEANMTWQTLEDLEIQRIERLAQYIREDPLWPPQPSYGMELMLQEGLNLPLVHCAFRGCTWTSDSRPCLRVYSNLAESSFFTVGGVWQKLDCKEKNEDSLYDCCRKQECLKQHIVEHHSKLFIESCGLELSSIP